MPSDKRKLMFQGPGANLRLAMGRPWTKAELRLLGTVPDDEAGRRMGRSLMSVRLKRQGLRIDAPLQPPWSEAETKLLGTAPDREVAKRLGRS